MLTLILKRNESIFNNSKQKTFQSSEYEQAERESVHKET